jgi:hypothetical protein
MGIAENKELNWEEYEEITKYIYQNLGAASGVKVKGHGRNCKLMGRSGVAHQVDVLTEQQIGGRVLLTAIECKFLRKKVTKGVVMQLFEIMEDAGIEIGIIVCKTGYTRDTLKFAEHKGIKLVKLWETGEKDLNGKHTIDVATLDININSTLTRPIITKIDLGQIVMTDEKEIMDMYAATMFNSDGNEVYFKTCLFAFGDDLEVDDILLKSTTRSYTPAGGTLRWNCKGEEVTIKEILITGYLTRRNSKSTKYFQIVDQVWLIMNEIFEKRRTTLAKSGLMYNLPDEG